MSSAADRNSPPGPSPTRRRSSFAGQFVDMFGSRPSNAGNSNQTMQGPISTAAMQAQTRRLSLTTIGLSGSPNPTSPFFPNGRPRTESISSSNSGTVDESPFEDGDAGTAPASPFARRLSFGARAMRDMRSSTGNANANGRPSVSIAKSPPTSKKGRGAGFDIAENMRTRAERGSISAAPGPPSGAVHQRAKSVAIMEPPRDMPVAAQSKRPDAFQERILKGDFYMD